MLNVATLKEKSLNTFEGIAITRRYFEAVKAMDNSTLAVEKVNVESVMSLWENNGKLEITGPEPIGNKRFHGTEELSSFYQKRSNGVANELNVNLSTVNVANAKSENHVVVSGMRYVVNRDGEGLQVPFTHNFELKEGKIQSLKIHIGTPERSEIAPIGKLQIHDLGKLAAMAWMVA